MAERDNDHEERELFHSAGMTTLQEFAASTHELFVALVEQGFTEEQAIDYCTKWAVALGRAES